jgi:hypothetical protein
MPGRLPVPVFMLGAGAVVFGIAAIVWGLLRRWPA